MKKTTRTVYGSRLQTALLLGMPFTHVENSTLNEKFDIQPGILPPNGEFPHLRYFCIGNGGHQNAVGADGLPFSLPFVHRPSDAALFRHLPFLMRELDNDLDVVARQRYALRKRITQNGVDYYAYYLKRIDMSQVVVNINHNSVVDGVETVQPFVPTSSNLNPVPPQIPATGAVVTTGDYLSASAYLNLSFDAEDVAELVNVCRILFDNEYYAIVSEIGLVAASDRQVTVTVEGGQTLSYLEAVSSTLAATFAGFFPVGFTNEGFEIILDVGDTEALFGVQE